MTEVKFYNQMDDGLLKFAVIIARYQGKFVYCKHKDRDTLEVAGGHRELGESIEDTARRELYEETGATRFELQPISIYSVTAPNHFDGTETFGMLYFAEISELETELHNEIEKIVLMDGLAENWTYSDIQPMLMKEARARGVIWYV